MFTDRAVAAQAIEAVKRLLGDLDQLLIDIEPLAPEAEYRQCRYGVGHVMAEVFERLAEPIAAGHPDLRYWAKSAEAPPSSEVRQLAAGITEAKRHGEIDAGDAIADEPL